MKGARSAYINQTNSTGHGAYRSPYIPVRGGRKYYASVYVKVSEGAETFNPLAIEWFEKPDPDYFISASDMDNKEIGTEFTLCELEATAPSNARYARIYLGNRGISGKWVYFDDVVFSEVRASKPTEGIVAGWAGGSASAVSVPANTWTELLSMTIPDEGHEVLFVYAGVVRHTNDSLIDGSVRIKVDSTYYPSSTGIHIWQSGHQDEYTHAYVLITIPKNVKGKTLKLEFRTANADTYSGELQMWGHSPHCHR